MWSELHLLRPIWLLALLPGCLLLLLWWRRPPGGGPWRAVVDAHLLPHLLLGSGRSPRALPFWLLGLAWLLTTLALAGPTWERIPRPVFGSSAARVLLLDLSASMKVADLRPSRLARARFEILDLLGASPDGQSALLAFGPEPFIVSPLTSDAKTIAAQVPFLTTDLVPVAGARDTARALRAAGELLARASARGGEILLVTDGVGDPTAARLAVEALVAGGHRVSVLAVGTRDGGPVPAGPDAAIGGFVTDRDGGVRIERLAEAELRELARLGRGRYVTAEAGDADTRALLAGGGSGRPVALDPSLRSDEWREEGPWLLLAVLPLAALAFRRGWLVPVLAGLLVLPADPARAFDWGEGWKRLWWRPDQEAAQRFAAGDSAGAAAGFRDPAWQAAARYRAGDYAGALAALADTPAPDAEYNRGNALARLGRFDEAIAAYRRALDSDPSDGDARHNLEVVQRLKDQPPESDTGGGSESGEGQGGATREDRSEQPSPGSGATPGDAEGGAGSSDEPGTDPDAESGSQSEPSDSSGEQPSGADPAEGTEGSGAGTGDRSESAGDRAPESRASDGSRRGSEDGPDDARGPATERTPPGRSGETSTADAGGSADPAPIGADAGAVTEPLTLSDESTVSDDAGDAPVPREPGAPSATDSADPASSEAAQAMEAQLRRVPDDPGGLLRQRFLLQHLRRQGRLP